MKFRFNLQLEVLLLAAAAQIVAGQFTITYFNSQRCIGLQLNCRNYRYFQCCDAPPTWENFYGIRVTSGGTFGLVVFSYPTRYGGCGACQYGGLLSRCYENFRPFNTAYVVVSLSAPHKHFMNMPSTSILLTAKYSSSRLMVTTKSQLVAYIRKA